MLTFQSRNSFSQTRTTRWTTKLCDYSSDYLSEAASQGSDLACDIFSRVHQNSFFYTALRIIYLFVHFLSVSDFHCTLAWTHFVLSHSVLYYHLLEAGQRLSFCISVSVTICCALATLCIVLMLWRGLCLRRWCASKAITLLCMAARALAQKHPYIATSSLQWNICLPIASQQPACYTPAMNNESQKFMLPYM